MQNNCHHLCFVRKIQGIIIMMTNAKHLSSTNIKGVDSMKKIFLDTETSGLKPGQICQLSFIEVDNDEIIPHNYFFEVDCVESGAERVHGFGVERLKKLSNGVKFKDVANEVFELLKDSLLICHNVGFDYGFLQSEFKRVDINYRTKWFCTMDYYTNIIQIPSPYYEDQFKWPRLSELLEFLEISETEVLTKAKELFNSEDIGFHDARFDVAGLYLAYIKGGLINDRVYRDCANFSYGDIEKNSFWHDTGICMNMKCNGIGERCNSCDKGPDCKDFDCNNCFNFKKA